MMSDQLFQEKLSDLISDARRTINEFKDVVRDAKEKEHKNIAALPVSTILPLQNSSTVCLDARVGA